MEVAPPVERRQGGVPALAGRHVGIRAIAPEGGLVRAEQASRQGGREKKSGDRARDATNANSYTPRAGEPTHTTISRTPRHAKTVRSPRCGAGRNSCPA